MLKEGSTFLLVHLLLSLIVDFENELMHIRHSVTLLTF